MAKKLCCVVSFSNDGSVTVDPPLVLSLWRLSMQSLCLFCLECLQSVLQYTSRKKSKRRAHAVWWITRERNIPKSIGGFWGSPRPDWWCFHHTKWFYPHHHYDLLNLIRIKAKLWLMIPNMVDNDVDNFNQMQVKISLMVQFNGVAAALIVCS